MEDNDKIEIIRHENSIQINEENSSTGIGIICSVSDENLDTQGWWDYCAAHIDAPPHSLAETLDYLHDNYDVEPLPDDDVVIGHFRQSVIMNLFPERLSRERKEFSMDMTDGEIETWYRDEESRRKEAAAYPTVELGLVFRGFSVPATGRNKPLVTAGIARSRKMMAFYKDDSDISDEQLMAEPGFLLVEETTGHMTGHGMAGGALCDILGAYRGVTQADIDERTPRFHSCVHDLANLGRLPHVFDYTGKNSE